MAHDAQLLAAFLAQSRLLDQAIRVIEGLTRVEDDSAVGNIRFTGTLAQIHRRAVRIALKRAKGNVSAAAAALGISRETLYRYQREHWL